MYSMNQKNFKKFLFYHVGLQIIHEFCLFLRTHIATKILEDKESMAQHYSCTLLPITLWGKHGQNKSGKHRKHGSTFIFNSVTNLFVRTDIATRILEDKKRPAQHSFSAFFLRKDIAQNSWRRRKHCSTLDFNIAANLFVRKEIATKFIEEDSLA